MRSPKQLLAALAVAALSSVGMSTAQAIDYYDPPQVYFNFTYTDDDAHIYGNRHSYQPPHRDSYSYDTYARPQHHHHHHHRPQKEYCEIRPGRPGKPHYRP